MWSGAACSISEGSIFCNLTACICRLYDPEREIVYKEFGIDTICPTVLSTREIDRLLGKAKGEKEA